MQHFLYRLRAPRPTFPADISEQEANVMQVHGDYWREQTEKGQAILFGPVLDPLGPWGLAIIEAEGERNAEEIAAADPAIEADLGFSFDLYPIQIGAMRAAQR